MQNDENEIENDEEDNKEITQKWIEVFNIFQTK